jgi:hypothetical protein
MDSAPLSAYDLTPVLRPTVLGLFFSTMFFGIFCSQTYNFLTHAREKGTETFDRILLLAAMAASIAVTVVQVLHNDTLFVEQYVLSPIPSSALNGSSASTRPPKSPLPLTATVSRSRVLRSRSDSAQWQPASSRPRS